MAVAEKVNNSPSATFVFGDTDEPHNVGDANCSAGWCGNEFPKPCQCGGLIHANFGDENANCDYWLYERCDKCG